MVELSDSPVIGRNHGKRRMIIWASAIALGLIISAVAWSRAAMIPIGSAGGLEIKVDFRGYDRVTNKGEFVFPAGTVATYEIILTNRTNITMTKIEAQSFLKNSKQRVPGNAFSPVYNTTLSPGQSFRFEVQYQVPDMPADLLAQLSVYTKYAQRGVYVAESLLCPTPLLFV